MCEFITDPWIEMFGGEGGASRRARKQAEATESIGDKQLLAAREGMALQRELAGQARADIEPLRKRQMGALDQYMQLLAGGGQDADLKRIQGEQEEALMARQAKMGMLGSGASTRSLSELGARIGEAREQRRFDRLGAVFGALPSTTGQLAGISSGLGQGLSNTLQQGMGNYGSLYGQAAQMRAEGGRASQDQLMQLIGMGLQTYGYSQLGGRRG